MPHHLANLSLVAAIRQLNDISYTTLIAQGRCESAQSSVVGSHALSRKDLSTGCTLFHSLIVSLSLYLLHSHCPAVLFFSHFMANKPTTSVVRHLIRFNVGSTSFLAFSYNFPFAFHTSHLRVLWLCGKFPKWLCEDAEFIDKNSLVWEKCKVLPFLGSWIFPK